MYVYAHWFWKLLSPYEIQIGVFKDSEEEFIQCWWAAMFTLSIFVPHLNHLFQKWVTDLMPPPTERPEPAATAVEEGLQKFSRSYCGGMLETSLLVRHVSGHEKDQINKRFYSKFVFLSLEVQFSETQETVMLLSLDQPVAFLSLLFSIWQFFTAKNVKRQMPSPQHILTTLDLILHMARLRYFLYECAVSLNNSEKP